MKTITELTGINLSWKVRGARKRCLANITSDGNGTSALPWYGGDVKWIRLTADGELQAETQYTGFKDEAWLRENMQFADEIIAALRACHGAAQRARTVAEEPLVAPKPLSHRMSD